MKNMMFIAFAIALVTGINAASYNSFATNNGYEVAAGGLDF